MPLPTIIYYGLPGLRADILADYFSNLGRRVHITRRLPDLFEMARTMPSPLVVIAEDQPPPTLVRLASAVIQDPSSAFPHIFILYDGEPFDPRYEAITVITGQDKLSALVRHILAVRPFDGVGLLQLKRQAGVTDDLPDFLKRAWLAVRQSGDESLVKSIDPAIAVTAKAAWELNDLLTGTRSHAHHPHHSPETLRAQVEAGIRLIEELLNEGMTYRNAGSRAAGRVKA